MAHMEIIFVGTVEIGHTVLKGIYETAPDITIKAIYTMSPEKKNNISGFIDFTPIADAYNTPLIKVHNINDKENIEQIQKIKPDLIVVCGWQHLLREEILNIPKLGAVGFHSSLLPKYRGRAPVNWAILLGERETGITMFYMTPGADDGDIVAQRSFPILFNDDCGTIYKKSAKAGAQMVKEYLPKIAAGAAPRLHNPSASYPAYPKRTPNDGLIDFNRSALDIYNFVRALTKPYPGAFYYNDKAEKIIVWKIEIIMDETRIMPEDIVKETLDFKIRILSHENMGAK